MERLTIPGDLFVRLPLDQLDHMKQRIDRIPGFEDSP